jgi:hypothetical protein
MSPDVMTIPSCPLMHRNTSLGDDGSIQEKYTNNMYLYTLHRKTYCPRTCTRRQDCKIPRSLSEEREDVKL